MIVHSSEFTALGSDVLTLIIFKSACHRASPDPMNLDSMSPALGHGGAGKNVMKFASASNQTRFRSIAVAGHALRILLVTHLILAQSRPRTSESR